MRKKSLLNALTNFLRDEKLPDKILKSQKNPKKEKKGKIKILKLNLSFLKFSA